MRNDFNKVLTERPRKGHKRKHKEVRKAYNSKFNVNYDNDEDGPLGGTEHMRRPYQNWDTRKNNTDLWSAIRRFMLSRVGRKWDDVWSEVNRDLHESDDMRAHWRVHCKIEVDEKITIAPNGRLWRVGGRRSFMFSDFAWDHCYPGEIPGLSKRFYVDPRDGILKEAPEVPHDWVHPARIAHLRKNPPEGPAYGWDMGDGVSIKYIEGIWYDVTFDPYQASEAYQFNTGLRDLTGRRVYETRFRMVTRYHQRKRQLNTRELVKYGVRNA